MIGLLLSVLSSMLCDSCGSLLWLLCVNLPKNSILDDKLGTKLNLNRYDYSQPVLRYVYFVKCFYVSSFDHCWFANCVAACQRLLDAQQAVFLKHLFRCTKGSCCDSGPVALFQKPDQKGFYSTLRFSLTRLTYLEYGSNVGETWPFVWNLIIQGFFFVRV